MLNILTKHAGGTQSAHLSKVQSLDVEKAALVAVKRQFLPLQSWIEKQKNYLERVSNKIESNQQKHLKSLKKIDRGSPANRPKPRDGDFGGRTNLQETNARSESLV